ncbi:3-carboxy-cis,cis-muconate cycloisomerase [Pseudooceanicola lipolyticus]|uniref:3-carboxy-cis,cis-muconate cycloisomerase n=1 Tax=Pseudooceanicola lipolyticus TaxID=2029104 RepID=A0A2M8J497_9RHOB|nr:3-carboxy-cis,cis-muconate cycloisomerase [Pseudooceanicola lipolyticus]MCC0027273.1 3-carboxy-cis,cis-muconate cycloisomerase [Brucellaceae bacterium]PJE37602.1 3-carboxy-cis,cis-muconate cycloisomerase [Pseudooceanicola lipolyticus]
MSVSVFDHPWLSGHFGDAEMAAILAPERQMAHMLAFEAVWSRACGRAGLFDAAAAEAATRAIETVRIDLADIATGMAQDGVPIPRLVKQLKAVAGSEAVHKGTTSQDVMDTALALTLQEASDLLAARLEVLAGCLDGLNTRFGDAPLMGRTRMQAAEPITVRDRVATWRLPLGDHLERLAVVRKRVEKVQIGGAAGDRKALGPKADQVVADVAAALGLAPTARAWHAIRDGVADYASFLSLVTGTLGKLGQDVVLMAQQGIDEIAMSGGGGSSAMPHKQNPVAAELLLTLARFNAVQVSAMHLAMIHEQERSGAAWTLEWMVLPQMLMTTARALAVAIEISQRITRIGRP